MMHADISTRNTEVILPVYINFTDIIIFKVLVSSFIQLTREGTKLSEQNLLIKIVSLHVII